MFTLVVFVLGVQLLIPSGPVHNVLLTIVVFLLGVQMLPPFGPVQNVYSSCVCTECTAIDSPRSCTNFLL